MPRVAANRDVARVGHPELGRGRARAQIPMPRRRATPRNWWRPACRRFRRWFAFQSQGASGGPWLGPSVEETLDRMASEGVKALMLQPIGFLCDHVEILYDVDIAFREYARQRGIQLERPESLKLRTLARAVADLARQSLDRLRRSAMAK